MKILRCSRATHNLYQLVKKHQKQAAAAEETTEQLTQVSYFCSSFPCQQSPQPTNWSDLVRLLYMPIKSSTTWRGWGWQTRGLCEHLAQDALSNAGLVLGEKKGISLHRPVWYSRCCSLFPFEWKCYIKCVVLCHLTQHWHANILTVSVHACSISLLSLSVCLSYTHTLTSVSTTYTCIHVPSTPHPQQLTHMYVHTHTHTHTCMYAPAHNHVHICEL